MILATIRKCLRNDHFDLIIMDIILRNASGLSYIQKIRTDSITMDLLLFLLGNRMKRPRLKLFESVFRIIWKNQLNRIN